MEPPNEIFKFKNLVFHCENQFAVPIQVWTYTSSLGMHTNHCGVFKMSNKISCQGKKKRKKKNTAFANSNPMRYILEDCVHRKHILKSLMCHFTYNGRNKAIIQQNPLEVIYISEACEEFNKFSARHPKLSCFNSACWYFDSFGDIWWEVLSDPSQARYSDSNVILQSYQKTKSHRNMTFLIMRICWSICQCLFFLLEA